MNSPRFGRPRPVRSRGFAFGAVFFFFLDAAALADGFELALLDLRALDFVRFDLRAAMAKTFLISESTTAALLRFIGPQEWIFRVRSL